MKRTWLPRAGKADGTSHPAVSFRTARPWRLLRPRAWGWLALAWLLLHPGFAPAQTLLLSEGFEGAFPGGWSVGNSGSGPTWRDVNATFGGEGTASGNWKGYCAGTAYPFNSNEPNPAYTNNMSAYLATNLNLRVCENRILLRFWSKIPSIQSGADAAKVFVDGNLVWVRSAPQTSWTEETVDLSSYAGGFHTVRFQFDSDGSVTAEGWYLDDINVTAYDTRPPDVTCPGDIVLDADPGQCSRSNVVFEAAGTDNCSAVEIVCDPPSGSTFPAGLTVVTCSAVDGAGNSNQCSFRVIVRDTPVVICPSNLLAYTCSNTATVVFEAIASNRCDYAGACIVPDNGSGTATLPPAGCQYIALFDVMRIIDGLPLGTTVELAPVLKDFLCTTGGVAVCSFPTSPGDCTDPGGILGGERQCSSATLRLAMNGTGTLAGYHRSINLPVGFEIHTAPRTPGAPIQSFDAEMFHFFGQITGDPDFDLLRITAGSDFGLFSPGHTTLTALPGGMWAVDSFFDITYRIDFVGAPGGPFAGRSGSTTGTIQVSTGPRPPTVTCTPPSGSQFPVGVTTVTCVAVNDWGRTNSCSFTVTVQAENRPPTLTCPSNIVVQSCSNSLPVEFLVIATNRCPAGPTCAVPDNGGGTADLPPTGCQYLAPFDVMYIVDGLPPGTKILMTPLLGNFLCPTGVVSVCSFPTSPGDCADPGGVLGGRKQCSDATLQLDMNGIGTLTNFHRTINLPVGLETHTAPRTPGAPIQSFDTEMARFFGQITGDPDFDLLRITAGSDFGLPSPGHTTLTALPGGMWAVDSFFDITYRVDFVGAPGGSLAGRSGSTTATVRLKTGDERYAPAICVPASGSAFPVGVTMVNCTAYSPSGAPTNCSFTVTVNGTTLRLNVARQGTNVLLSWPEVCAAHRLQSAPHLTPPIPWSNMANVPALVGGEWRVIVPVAAAQQFYRLYLP